MDTLHFDEGFDAGAWPGPFGAAATAGEWWVGTSGLEGQLEGQVGLGALRPGATARLAEAMRALESTAGFWSRSCEADPLATAEALTRLVDLLRLHGWERRVGSPRLDALFGVFAELPEGLGDRLAALAPVLKRTADLRWRVHLLRGGQPRRVREVLEACADVVLTAPPPPPLDLEALAPRLQLVRPFGPRVAAEAVAQALAATPEVPTLVIGGDAVLDAALRRYGLPTTGAASSPLDNALCNLLPLVVELGCAPSDPHRAVEFLTLPGGPIRPDAARRLVRALQKWPAVHSEAWHRQLEKLETEPEWTDEMRALLQARLAEFFTAPVPVGAPYPVPVLVERCAGLQRWLHGSLEHEAQPARAARLEAASAQVTSFGELLRLTGAAALPMSQVRRLLEQAQADMPTPSSWPAQAGLVALGDPGGVAAAAPRLVWWNFTREAFASPPRLPLDRAELAALAQHGVHVPSPSEEAIRRMAAARRPLHFAGSDVWLVCPAHQPNGDEATPHPLWDEVVGALQGRAAALEVPEPRVARPLPPKQRKALAALGPRVEWQAGVKLPRRAQESPSSIEGLLGCSLKWALEYVANLKAGTSAALDTSERMLGSLAHHLLLERVLRRPHATPEAAGAYALEALAQEGPSLAAPLFLPGADAELLAVKDALRKAAVALQALVARGWRVAETEQEHVGKAFGTAFGGVIDLVLHKGKQRAVVDLKWSGAGHRRGQLVEGTALQLAAYAELLRQAGFADTVVAYFIIKTQALLTTDAGLADGAGTLEAKVDGTWEALVAAHGAAWKRASKGELVAPGARRPEPRTARDEAAGLVASPPCRFCDLSGVCGRRYGVEEGTDEAG